MSASARRPRAGVAAAEHSGKADASEMLCVCVCVRRANAGTCEVQPRTRISWTSMTSACPTPTRATRDNSRPLPGSRAGTRHFDRRPELDGAGAAARRVCKSYDYNCALIVVPKV